MAPSRPWGDAALSAEVVDAARAGEAWAFEVIYRQLAGPVAGYLRAHGATEVADLTSEVFLGVLRGIHAFRGDEAQLRSWVFVIAHRRVQDQRRAAGRARPAQRLDDGVEPVGPTDAADDALAVHSTRRVQQLCAALPPDQRDVLLLRIVADLTVPQVAEVMGKSNGAVKQLQRRGLEALRRAIGPTPVPF